MVGAVGGEQILNMGDGCQYVGLVLHEFGHAIGYYHEHNRPDRDDTVEIMWDNIVYGELGLNNSQVVILLYLGIRGWNKVLGCKSALCISLPKTQKGERRFCKI